MPRTIKADGRTITVPDDATPDEINQIVGPAPAVSTDPSGRTPTGEPAAGDSRNSVQRYLDNLITPDPRREEWQSPVKTGIDRFAQGVAGNVIPLISHPIQSGLGMVKSVGNAIANPDPDMGAPGTGIVSALLRPAVEGAVRDYQENGAAKALPHLLGQGVGMAATGELGNALGGKLLEAASPSVSGLAERTGLALGNNALGAKGPKLFKYGANPARGAYEEGVLPAMGKSSAAQKVESALPEVGQRISAGVMQGKNIPAAELYPSVEAPLDNSRAIIEGPGGANRSAEPLNALQESMTRTAPNATRPIYGLGSGTSSTAPDVWHTIRNIDANTRFNPDPEVEGLNEVRRSIRGGLRGNLEDAAPQIIQPSQTYSDLMGARESLDRTMHGGMSAGKLLSIPTFPVESGIGRLLYGASKMPNPQPLIRPIATATPLLTRGQNETNP